LDVSIEGLTITGGNSGLSSGGGILATCPLTTASLALDDVVITENQTALSKAKGSGGGIFSYNVDLEITGSTISDNDAYLSGGGIAVFRADITLTESTIAENTTTVADGGGIFGLYTAMEIARSTISGNTAADSGGGIAAVRADLYLENSTISGNTAGAGAKSDGHGGGIYVLYANLYLDHSTIAENTAVRGPALSAVYADVLADHTIFADSTGAIAQRVGTAGAESAAADPDLYLYNVYQDFNWSLIENPGSLTIEGANNITGDPALGALGENGGPTQTQVPGLGSPVLDAGDPAITGEPPTDQRGLPRVQGAAIEIGAVEQQEAVSVLEIPTLGGAGLAALGAGLAAAGAAALRQRRRD
jgi:predicted outer membrane repeat protein